MFTGRYVVAVVNQHILLIFSSLRRCSPAKYHPWTNILALHEVIEQLQKTYDECFGDLSLDTVSPAWQQLSLWKETVLNFRSVTEFVLAKVVPGTPSAVTSPLLSESE